MIKDVFFKQTEFSDMISLQHHVEDARFSLKLAILVHESLMDLPVNFAPQWRWNAFLACITTIISLYLETIISKISSCFNLASRTQRRSSFG
ncbi:hypothetical protein HMPREF2861_03125 [Lactobacillus sp. HMSC068F07]|nr:hypothetical protein HMPREF2861_03125 [Lactobacillus sp. HMSC068F07]